MVNASFYASSVVEAVHSPTLVYMSGVAALLGGLAILNAYRAWTADWRVIITIFGWLCTIGGIARIVLPRLIASVATTIYSGPEALTVVGVIVLVVGGYLTFRGYRQ